MGMSCFFFKQKTAYEMRISDWSSDACSSDLGVGIGAEGIIAVGEGDIADDGAEGGRLIQRDRRAPGPRREAGEAQRKVMGIDPAVTRDVIEYPLILVVDVTPIDLELQDAGRLGDDLHFDFASIDVRRVGDRLNRSEEHPSEFQ